MTKPRDEAFMIIASLVDARTSELRGQWAFHSLPAVGDSFDLTGFDDLRFEVTEVVAADEAAEQSQDAPPPRPILRVRGIC
jgi:hypothetical protein